MQKYAGPSAIRAMLFDTFGTVVDWREGIAREAAPFIARHRVAVDAYAFADAWRGRYQPSMEAVRSGKRPFARLDVLHRESLLTLLHSFGVAADAIPAEEIDDLNRAWHRLEPWPDVIEGLRRLKPHYIIAPLSNGNIALLTNMAKRAGLPWDCILGAEVAQAYKPMPESYVRTAEVLGLTTAECMLVAAHGSDLDAAAATGMRTAFVSRPTEYGPTKAADVARPGSWDIVADSFLGLADAMS